MSNTITDFLFAAAETGKPVEVLRTGTFVDRNGREITITEEDIDAFIANFEAGEAGQDVPIDIDHERAAAAGWIKRVWREGLKLLAETEWNSLGQDLVGNKIYQYLSATIDMGRKVIKSVSLVNFPAVKGLKAVELSEGVYSLQGEGGEDQKRLWEFFINGFNRYLVGRSNEDQIFSEENTMTEKVDVEKLKAEVRAELEAELVQKQQTEAELREQVKAELEAELKAKYERRQSLVEFADELCNGEYGLSMPPAEVVELLEALPEDQLETAKKLLKAKVVSFSETGSSRDGANGKAQLPDYAVKDVKAGTITVAELFEAKAIGGKMEDYNLAEFTSEQIG